MYLYTAGARPPCHQRETALNSFAFCFTEKRTMKLYLIFLLMDGVILLTYPFIYIVNKVRRFVKFKR